MVLCLSLKMLKLEINDILPLFCLASIKYVSWYLYDIYRIIKGNNKITEHRAIFQRKRQELICQHTDKISQQPENWQNHNGPDLIQAFPKKWWVESDFTAPILPLPLWLKDSVVTMTVFLTILGQNRHTSSQRSTLWKSFIYYRLCRTD